MYSSSSSSMSSISLSRSYIFFFSFSFRPLTDSLTSFRYSWTVVRFCFSFCLSCYSFKTIVSSSIFLCCSTALFLFSPSKASSFYPMMLFRSSILFSFTWTSSFRIDTSFSSERMESAIWIILCFASTVSVSSSCTFYSSFFTSSYLIFFSYCSRTTFSSKRWIISSLVDRF